MAEGHKGAGPYSKNYADFDRPADYSKRESPHDQSLKYGNEFSQACAPWDEPTWKPGKVSSGGKFHSTNGPPKGDATTRPVEAASPSGKFAKKGGKGKGFGS